MFKCKKCGSKSYELRPKGTATGLYCADCGFWHKWVAKDELYRYQGLQKANIRSGGNMTNRQWLESLSDEEYAKFLSIVMRYGTDFVWTCCKASDTLCLPKQEVIKWRK